jgi:hypothetical protein
MVATPPPSYPGDPSVPIKKAHARLIKLGQLEEEARRLAQHCWDVMNANICKLASCLRQSGAEPFASVRSNAVSLFGDVGGKLLDYVGKQNRVLLKQSASVLPSDGRIDLGKPPYSLVKLCLDSAKVAREAQTTYLKVAEEAKKEVDSISGPFEAAKPPSPPPPPKLKKGPASKAVSAAEEHSEDCSKKAFFGSVFGTVAGTTAAKEIVNRIQKPTGELELKVKNKLNDPQHMAELRNMQTESMLSDLLANDEVISGHDPNEVIHHFNEISRLAPRASSQSGLMRVLLRKRLQSGAMDPYDLDLLMKLEQRLKEQETMPGLGVLGGGSSVVD